MRTLQELIDTEDAALPLIQEWAAGASHPFEILAPSLEDRARVLLALQVTTRSTMGAVAHDTGGLLIDHGWLRVLGSGHPRLARNIVDWNKERSSGFLLVADDVVGGFFALNGGGLGEDAGAMYYRAPDTLAWESLEIGYSDFLEWASTDRLQVFYADTRWSGWEADMKNIGADQCFNFFPFLWTKEGSVHTSSRKAVSVAEQYAFNVESAGTSR
ncbi:DUF2625 domain-containing protein [Variovorax sp. EL159]|uniref:DUF2625 domain-containing protein n=1 Tax=Variovorax sp. EL159 TaxID=1566270 RepID=UPI0008806CB6|nr:DUF2625 domain-containing protein [Variovorax sp. EL159]SCX44463.1 Protein of unknown function DUF2625 [Variovorax sp. EL159]